MLHGKRCIAFLGLVLICLPSVLQAVNSGEPTLSQPDATAGSSVSLSGLRTVSAQNWNSVAVRRVLQAFAFGGLASDQQIEKWAAMGPEPAIVEMLNFDQPNLDLSPPAPGDPTSAACHSLTELQSFWSSDHPQNPVQISDRPYYATLTSNKQLNPAGLFLVWVRAMHTRGCNPFLHKMAFYLTNYHAAIHVRNAGVGLIRDYYDDTIGSLMAGKDFVGLMTDAAKNGALALSYGHATNVVNPRTGLFSGNDDFAREYFQLLFGIQGTTEDAEYHEDVTIENNALLLTGMLLDQQPSRFGSAGRLDWFLSNINFTDHQDATGRRIYNRSNHFDFRKGAASCLDILHQSVCGATAEEKLLQLGPIAAAHRESLANIPVRLITFFADSEISPDEAASLQAAWADAHFDLLHFIRAYAISTQFHGPGTFKYWSAFERNLIVQNATILDNVESFARAVNEGPALRIFSQGAVPFAPVRDVFGGQTGNDAANDRYVFKNAWGANVEQPEVLAAVNDSYKLSAGGPVLVWRKHWDQVIPSNSYGEYKVEEVAEWLWNRLIADGGANFDPVARAQVYSLLAAGTDFGMVVDRRKPEAIFSSADILSGSAKVVYEQLAAVDMDLTDPIEQHNVGMAINFISMLPFAFGQGGASK